jgi:hypothetical protein
VRLVTASGGPDGCRRDRSAVDGRRAHRALRSLAGARRAHVDPGSTGPRS